MVCVKNIRQKTHCILGMRYEMVVCAMVHVLLAVLVVLARSVGPSLSDWPLVKSTLQVPARCVLASRTRLVQCAIIGSSFSWCSKELRTKVRGSS